jgi:uncharacterized YccA/Bax inhibitor family protein
VDNDHALLHTPSHLNFWGCGLQPTRALDGKSLDTATSANQANSELALTLKVLGWGLLGAFAVVAILVFDGQTSDSTFWYWVMGALFVIAVPLLLTGYRVDRSSEASQ